MCICNPIVTAAAATSVGKLASAGVNPVYYFVTGIRYGSSTGSFRTVADRATAHMPGMSPSCPKSTMCGDPFRGIYVKRNRNTRQPLVVSAQYLLSSPRFARILCYRDGATVPTLPRYIARITATRPRDSRHAQPTPHTRHLSCVNRVAPVARALLLARASP